MPLISVSNPSTSKEAYNLLTRILSMPDCPWKHRVHPYATEQTKLIDSTLAYIQILLDGSYFHNAITSPLSPDIIYAVFTKAAKFGSRYKTVLSFIYDEFSHESPFAHHYSQMQKSEHTSSRCQVLGYDSLLKEYGLDPTDPKNTEAILSLAAWYKMSSSLLSYANYGSWEWEGFSDFHGFFTRLAECLNEHANLYGQNLLPDSYGMSIFDRAMRKKGMKIRLTPLEEMAAQALKKRIDSERHAIIYTPFDPTLVGNVEAELTARAEYATMIHSVRGGLKL